MKKLIAIILILCSCLSLFACGDEKYPPAPSTDEEAEVMMTFSYEDEKYELKYELYRALFLNLSGEYDGGNRDFWKSDAASLAKADINERIISLAADIFATLHIAKAIGFNPYSKDVNEQISEYVENSVDGSDDGEFEGFGGDYDAYLASLKAKNMNYSVQTLLLRYSIAYDAVIKYYTGTVDSENPTTDMESGSLEFTKGDVRAFYDGELSARVSLIVINSTYIPKETAAARRDAIASAPTRDEALAKAIQLTSGTPSDILDGVVIGKHSLDAAYYSKVTSTALELEVDEVSELIEITSADTSEYWILYKLDKTEEYFNENYDAIEDVYISERIGEIIENAKSEIIKSKSTKAAFEELDLSGISM